MRTARKLRSSTAMQIAKRVQQIAAEYSKKHGIDLLANMPGSMDELDQWLQDGIEAHLTLNDGTPLKTIIDLDAARQGPSKERKAEIRERAEGFMRGDQRPRFWNDKHEYHFFERCIFEISSRNAAEEIQAKHERHVRVGRNHHKQKSKANGKTVDHWRERFAYWYGKRKTMHGAATEVAKESGFSVGAVRMAAKRGRWIE